MGGLTQDFPSQGVEEWVKSLALTCLVSLLWMSVASQSEGEGCAAACHHTELPTWGGHLPVCVHRHDHHWPPAFTNSAMWFLLLWWLVGMGDASSYSYMYMYCIPTGSHLGTVV